MNQKSCYRVLLIFAIVFLFTNNSYSQKNKARKLVFESSIFGGINYNYTSLQEVNKSLFYKGFLGLTFKVGKQTNGVELWHKPFNYPINGFGITYTQISKNRIVGNPVSLYNYLNVPFKIFTNKVCFEMENGIAYFINDRGLFSSLEKNPVVGSRLNFHVGMELSFVIPSSKKYTTNIGVKVQHYSNGNIRTPNFGVNLIGLSAKIKYEPKKASVKRNQFNSSVKSNQINKFSLSPRFAFNTHRKNNKPNEYFILLVFDYWRRYSPVGYLNAGLDNFYGTSLNVDRSIEKHYMSFHIGHKLKANKVAVITQVGFFLKKRSEDSDKFFTRISIEYKLLPNFNLLLSLKSRQSMSADFIEWGGIKYF